MLGRKKKVQDCDYVFGSSTKFQRRMNGFVKADICRQVSVCLHVFCGILFALKPFCDYNLCSVCILPQPAFYSQSVVCILHSVCILLLVRSLQSAVRSPQSAVRSPQSAVRSPQSAVRSQQSSFYTDRLGHVGSETMRFSWKFSGQCYMPVFCLFHRSPWRNCGHWFWYGLKDLFNPHKFFSDKVVLGR